MPDVRTVVVSGGGTGGHLYPALAIADALRAERPDVHVLFVGAERGLEARVLPERGEEHLLLPLRGIDRSRLLGNWKAIAGLLEKYDAQMFQLPGSCVRSVTCEPSDIVA